MHPEKPDTDYPLYRAMRKCGAENFVIDEVENVTDDKLNERECYWIQQYNSYVPNGYNCTLGGDGDQRFNHNDILQCFLNQGNKNASETARLMHCSLNTVLKVLEVNQLDGLGTCQPIYQIDLNTGKIVKEFQSLIDACNELKISKTQLWSAVNHQAKTAGGYAWCKIQEYDEFNLADHIDNKKIPVKCIETNQIFNSVVDACMWLKENKYSVNPSSGNIIKVCNGERKTAYRFHWSKLL